MSGEPYRDMHLLNEVTRTPDATQRDLANRIGSALGLTNLLLRRLAKKGFIKIVNVQKSRWRYLVTPAGMMEKARLTREYVEYSLFLYRRIRIFLQRELRRLAHMGQRRIVLWGTGELAEIAYLTINELGLELVGVVDHPPAHDRFLGFVVRRLEAVRTFRYDCILIASPHAPADSLAQLRALGVPDERMLLTPIPGLPGLDAAPEEAALEETALSETQVEMAGEGQRA